jgi:hypothetical protein
VRVADEQANSAAGVVQRQAGDRGCFDAVLPTRKESTSQVSAHRRVPGSTESRQGPR